MGSKGTPGSPRPAVVAIGASAGGLNALMQVLEPLPADLGVPVLVVQHLSPNHPSRLAEILVRHTSLAVAVAEDGAVPQPGTVHIAVPDQHLEVTADRRLRLGHTEQVHFVRPSFDRLLESLAAHYGEEVLAVVLTGSGSDGAQGVVAVKDAGGTVIVEDDRTAEFTGMPQAAIATGRADMVLSLDQIGPAIARIVSGASRPVER